MVALNILEEVSGSAWASPTFIISKPNGTVRMVLDFRNQNPYAIMVLYKN